MAAGTGTPLRYFDNSALGRLTDPAPEVVLPLALEQQLLAEADAVAQLIEAVRVGRLLLGSSEALRDEVGRAPARVRLVSLNVLALASVEVAVRSTELLARSLLTGGFRRYDALHIAAAYTMGADYLVSCDEHFLRRVTRVARLLGGGPAIVSPAECVRREGLPR